MNKMIYGNVNGDGSVKTGYDFKVVRLAKGTYEIDFSITFPSMPTVLVTQNYPGWDDNFGGKVGNTKDNAVVVTVSENKVKIRTGKSDGSADDRNFSFLAICEIQT